MKDDFALFDALATHDSYLAHDRSLKGGSHERESACTADEKDASG